jgi:hypothetical protein
MKTFFIVGIFFLTTLGSSYAQRFFHIEYDSRWQCDVGIGAGYLNQEYPYKKLALMTTEGLAWQIHSSVKYLVSDKFNVGIKLGGVFRPTFLHDYSGNVVQQKFTPVVLVTTDYFLSGPDRKSRFYLGVGAGITNVGVLEGRNPTTKITDFYKHNDKPNFLTVAPKFGVSFGEIKIEAEYQVMIGFSPDFPSISIISALPIGKPKYYW